MGELPGNHRRLFLVQILQGLAYVAMQLRALNLIQTAVQILPEQGMLKAVG